MLAIRNSLAGCVIASCSGSSVLGRLGRRRHLRLRAVHATEPNACARPTPRRRGRLAGQWVASSAEQERLGQAGAFEVLQVHALVDRVVLAPLVRGAVDQDLGVGERPGEHRHQRDRAAAAALDRPRRPYAASIARRIAANAGPSLAHPQPVAGLALVDVHLHAPGRVLEEVSGEQLRPPEPGPRSGASRRLTFAVATGTSWFDASRTRGASIPSTETAGADHSRSAIGPEPMQPRRRAGSAPPPGPPPRTSRRLPGDAPVPRSRRCPRRRAAWRGSAPGSTARRGSRPPNEPLCTARSSTRTVTRQSTMPADARLERRDPGPPVAAVGDPDHVGLEQVLVPVDQERQVRGGRFLLALDDDLHA